MEQMRKPVTGRTEMDILQEVASKYRCDYEAAGMRGLIREAMTGGMLPPPKSPEETEARKAKYRQALQVDEELEQLGCRLFFARERSRHRQSERPETAT